MEPQEPAATVDPTPSTPNRPGRLWALALVASILAGLGSWMAGEATRFYFVPSERIVVAMGIKMNIPSFEEKVKAGQRNATLANGTLGGLLGLLLGLAGGLARGSVRSAPVPAIAGVLIGLVAGVGSSEAVLPYYYHQLDKGSEELSKDLILPLIIHSVSWAAVGLAGGIALGLGQGARGRIASAALGGLVGGVLGAGAYEVIGALVFPTGGTSEPLAAHWAPRLIGKLLVTTLATALAVVAIQSPARRSGQAQA
jgi:hypothetical protein